MFLVCFPLRISLRTCSHGRCQEDRCFLISKDPLHCYVEHAVKPLANIRLYGDLMMIQQVRAFTRRPQTTFRPCSHAVYRSVQFTVVQMVGVVAVLAVAAATGGGAWMGVRVGGHRAGTAGEWDSKWKWLYWKSEFFIACWPAYQWGGCLDNLLIYF